MQKKAKKSDKELDFRGFGWYTLTTKQREEITQ